MWIAQKNLAKATGLKTSRVLEANDRASECIAIIMEIIRLEDEDVKTRSDRHDKESKDQRGTGENQEGLSLHSVWDEL